MFYSKLKCLHSDDMLVNQDVYCSDNIYTLVLECFSKIKCLEMTMYMWVMTLLAVNKLVISLLSL